MFKYYKFIRNKHYKKVKVNNFRVKSRFENYKYYALRKIFYYSSRISFLKKFTMSVLFIKKKFHQTISFCHASGKARSCISKLSLKRHTYKKYITHNFIPNMVKKHK